MTRTTNAMRVAMGLALLAPALLAGCGGSETVQRTTTERTTTVAPSPMQAPTQSSTTTTTTTTRAPN